MGYVPTIGLEVHVELKTKSKMFCACPNDPSETRPNVNVCPVCMGHPGVLPVINEEAARKTIKTGLAMDCQIHEHSRFDRKNYFYPDLPKGYQISQYGSPFCGPGFLKLNDKKIGIRRVHLEEDTGKLLHPESADYSLVDFNRAGIPLMELVTEPDLTSAQEARKFAEELRLILKYLDVSHADMEKGELRIEANVSLKRGSQKPETRKIKLGTKVEIKNLNSFRALEKAIEYEIKRQTKLLKANKKVMLETRGWHDKKEITFSQREKEESHDYRYFPEPDLPQLHLGTPSYLQKLKAGIAELPQCRRQRFKKEYCLPEQDIEVFVFNKSLGEYFEKVVSELKNWAKEAAVKERAGESEFEKLSKLASNYILTNLQTLLKDGSITDDAFLITPENFAELITLIHKGELSSKTAKTVLKEMFEKGGDPSHIIEEKGLNLIREERELEIIIKKIIAANPKAVADYKSGKQTALQFLVGKAMRETNGQAEPNALQKLLKKLLS